MPKVYSRRSRDIPAGAVYVGRPTKWGNPFSIIPGRPRAMAISLFTEWVMKPEQEALREAAKRELRGKDLVCWCAPLDCHAWVWIKIANFGHQCDECKQVYEEPLLHRDGYLICLLCYDKLTRQEIK